MASGAVRWLKIGHIADYLDAVTVSVPATSGGVFLHFFLFFYIL